MPSTERGVADRIGPWVLGLAAAVLAIGPGLGPGSWLNVDLVATPITPVPRGVWGIGPELPRRVPYALPFAWASSVVDSTWVLKAVMVVAIAAAVAGSWRLAQRWFADLPLPAAAGAGLLYGLSPFLLTRLGVGHLPLVMAMGLLPWAVPTALDPCRSVRRTFLWSVAIGLTGVLGGVLVLLAVPVTVLLTPRSERRVVRPLGLLLVSQVPWLVPGILVLVQGAAPAGASEFATSRRGAGGLLRVLAGHGFWRTTSQVGLEQGRVVPILGLVLVGLASVGAGRLLPELRRPLLGVAGVGLLIPLGSALPLVRQGYSALIDSPVGATLREGQRLLPLYLVVVTPLAAGGAAHLARRWPGWREGILLLSPVAMALTLAGPGLWGVDGALQPVHLPASWREARHVVHRGGGTVLSLPFTQYVTLAIAGGRSVVDPMPVFLGGDVLSSSNPGLRTPSQERADPREAGATRIVAGLKDADHPAASALAAIGVHYVVVRHDYDWATYRALRTDPGFRHVLASPELDLYEVRPWSGVAVDASGGAVPVGQTFAPFASIRGSGRVTWFRPGLEGWMRGWHQAGTTDTGAIDLPAGDGPVWFWPSAIALLFDLSLLCVVVLSLWPHWPHNPHSGASAADP